MRLLHFVKCCYFLDKLIHCLAYKMSEILTDVHPSFSKSKDKLKTAIRYKYHCGKSRCSFAYPSLEGLLFKWNTCDEDIYLDSLDQPKAGVLIHLQILN